MRLLGVILAVAVALAVAEGRTGPAAGASAKTFGLSAKMSAKQVVTVKNRPWKTPSAVANAKGTFTGTFDNATRKLTWRITYTGIGNPKLALADIHVGPSNKFGAIIVRLCGPCKSGQKGVKTIKRSYVSAITSGNSWVTVITDKYPNGVIRGQIKATSG
jgi:hypothetical protein